MFEYKILPMGSSLNFEYELGDSLDGWDFSMRKVICKSDICCRESDMRYIIETTKTDAGTRVLPITEDAKYGWWLMKLIKIFVTIIKT